MKLHLLKTVVTTVAIMSLSACAQTQREVAPQSVEQDYRPSLTQTEASTEEGFQEWVLVVEGLPTEGIVDDKERARAILLEVLGSSLDDGQLAELLAETKNNDTTAADLRARLGGSDSLSGIAGFPVVQFLEAYVTGVQQIVHGKIRKYYFNDDQKSGYLEVDTTVETLQNGAVVNTDTYFWAIAVRPETYEVRNHSGDRNNPFPGTVALMEPKLTDIEMRRLDQKLWAKGTGIVVIAVRKNGVLLPTNNFLYTSTSSSCIDMMFWGYPPKSELPRQQSYCLGRCDHPQVVNTD